MDEKTRALTTEYLLGEVRRALSALRSGITATGLESSVDQGSVKLVLSSLDRNGQMTSTLRMTTYDFKRVSNDLTARHEILTSWVTLIHQIGPCDITMSP